MRQVGEDKTFRSMFLRLIASLIIVPISLQANVRRNIFDSGDGYLSYPISLISDQDGDSKDTEAGNWYSTIVSASLHISTDGTVAVADFLTRRNFTSKWNYGGRGMELSDLKMYNGKLLSVDDKTGIIYRLQGKKVVPWVVFADANGNEDKPFKGEWLAVKDNNVYCGGYGKEFTTSNGTFIDDSPFWIKVVSPTGGHRSENWKDNFMGLRKHLEINFPGYMIHESAQWSNVHKKWFFLPRHLSKLQYTSKNVHTTGANVLLSANEDFSNITHVYIGVANTPRGFSAFQFVPGTNDQQIVALKSEEVPDEPLNSFIMVFNVNGTILMNETEIPGNLKCEGVEFYDAQLGIYPFAEYATETSTSASSYAVISLAAAMILNYL